MSVTTPPSSGISGLTSSPISPSGEDSTLLELLETDTVEVSPKTFVLLSRHLEETSPTNTVHYRMVSLANRELQDQTSKTDDRPKTGIPTDSFTPTSEGKGARTPSGRLSVTWKV